MMRMGQELTRRFSFAEDFSGLRDQWIRDGGAFILVYSLNDRKSFTALEQFIGEVFRGKRGWFPGVLAGNKCDLVDTDMSSASGSRISGVGDACAGTANEATVQRAVSMNETRELSDAVGWPCFDVSAKSAHNLEEVFFNAVRGAIWWDQFCENPSDPFAVSRKRSLCTLL
jgi:GTPase KRas